MSFNIEILLIELQASRPHQRKKSACVHSISHSSFRYPTLVGGTAVRAPVNILYYKCSIVLVVVLVVVVVVVVLCYICCLLAIKSIACRLSIYRRPIDIYDCNDWLRSLSLVAQPTVVRRAHEIKAHSRAFRRNIRIELSAAAFVSMDSLCLPTKQQFK